MQEIVGIQYKSASKVYYFSPKGEKFNLNDEVLVETMMGPAYGVVALENKMVEDSEIEEPFRSIIRKVNDQDRKQLEKIRDRAQKDFPVILSKIEQLGLDMKVVEVEYSFDETKVTISYTADGRVDFRELLKILASTLKVKIELRQIGTRDEVKTVGAMGLCGRECCCTKFLKESEHVTVKMAKLQNLSMSPTKTGGACGKMMCCLAFEDPVYKMQQERMPKVGTTIKTPDGDGIVQCNDLLKEIVTVKITYPDESYKFKDFTLAELGLNNKEEIDNAKEETNKTAEKEASKTNLVNNDNSKVDNKAIQSDKKIFATEDKNKYNNNNKAGDNSEKKNKKRKFWERNHKNNKKGETTNGIQNNR